MPAEQEPSQELASVTPIRPPESQNPFLMTPEQQQEAIDRRAAEGKDETIDEMWDHEPGNVRPASDEQAAPIIDSSDVPAPDADSDFVAESAQKAIQFSDIPAPRAMIEVPAALVPEKTPVAEKTPVFIAPPPASWTDRDQTPTVPAEAPAVIASAPPFSAEQQAGIDARNASRENALSAFDSDLNAASVRSGRGVRIDGAPDFIPPQKTA